MTPTEKLTALRHALTTQKLGGFLLPVGDRFLSEYPPPSSQRLAWLTGFDGSAGTLLVLHDQAIVFTDGRYTLQAAKQLPKKLYSVRNNGEQSPAGWLAAQSKKLRIGYDPQLFSIRQLAVMESLLEDTSVTLVAMKKNPIDALWEDRPAEPANPLLAYGLGYTGEKSADKRIRVCAALKAEGAEALLVSACDSLAWLLNIRGSDLLTTPIACAVGLLLRDAKHPDGRLILYIDEHRLNVKTRAHLGERVTLVNPALLPKHLPQTVNKKTLWVDSNAASAWYGVLLEEQGIETLYAEDPCQKLKAQKNKVEIANSIRVHRADGAALTRFLCWLEKAAKTGKETEVSIADKLKGFRAATKGFYSLSFDTIAGFAEHGAIVHYRATPKTAKTIIGNGVLLVDSGGQYWGGTTDVTRTLSVGTVSMEAKRAFTRVLKGHIALASVTFPQGTSGSQLDALARQSLWQVGLDYDHGTGHGVGSFLGVHEGPQRISKSPSTVVLKEGMILSNEPGYYKTGAYGIRIENLVRVIARPDLSQERAFLGFDTLTLAPIDQRMIVPTLLSASEKDWLNHYHARVKRTLSPLLNKAEQQWLERVTRAV
jgi:Xaa-Pro aminopeptidase